MQKDFDRSSTNNFENPFGNLSKNILGESADFVAYEPLVNGYNLANKHDTSSQQARMSLFRTFDAIVTALGCRMNLRSDSNQDNIFARAVECIGRNNQGRSLLQRAEISERERYEDNVTTFIDGHISNLVHYSRIQTKAQQASVARVYQRQGRLISEAAQATAVGLRVLTSLLRAQFEVRINFA